VLCVQKGLLSSLKAFIKPLFSTSFYSHHLYASVDERFQTAQSEFLEKYVDVFEDTDENKLEYTGIFKEWVSEERERD
jgi:hypothetical protein